MNVLGKLRQIALTQGKNDKLSLLEQHRTDSDLTHLLTLAFNPMMVFGLKKVEYNSDSLPEPYQNKYKEFVNLANYVLSNNTNNEVREQVTKFLNSCSRIEAEVYADILTKKLTIGVTAKSINKAYGYTLIPVFGVMLASPSNENTKYVFPVVVEEKLDGVRCIIIKHEGTCKAYTRQGKALVLPKLFKELESLSSDNFVLDGELLDHEDRLKTTATVNKILKGNKGKDLDSTLKFHVFDMFTYPEFVEQSVKLPQYKRSMDLEIWLTSNLGIPSFVKVDSIIADDYEDIKNMYDIIRSQGGEGIIIKDPKGKYEFKRSKGWVKEKAVSTCTLKVVGVFEGEGKYKGMLGGLTCTSECGVIHVNVGSGLTDKDRADLWEFKPIGKFVEVIYNEVQQDSSDNYYLFLPRFKEIRLDKDEADTLSKIIQESK